MTQWIRYIDKTEGEFFVNPDTEENIQAYGNDVRYPDFKKKIEAGEVTVVDYKESDHKLDNDKLIERQWRDMKLQEMDILINILEDEGKDISNVRAFRVTLRNYPSQDGFPYNKRPVYVENV